MGLLARLSRAMEKEPTPPPQNQSSLFEQPIKVPVPRGDHNPEVSYLHLHQQEPEPDPVPIDEPEPEDEESKESPEPANSLDKETTKVVKGSHVTTQSKASAPAKVSQGRRRPVPDIPEAIRADFDSRYPVAEPVPEVVHTGMGAKRKAASRGRAKSRQ